MSLGKNMVTKNQKNMEDKIYLVDVTKLYFKHRDNINSECKVQVFWNITRITLKTKSSYVLQKPEGTQQI